MFTAALFTISKLWKQCKCSSVGEQVKKLCYIYTMEYYVTEKKKEKETLTFSDSMGGTGNYYDK